MYPVDEQGCLPEKNQRTESPGSRAPAAPGVARGQNHQQHSHANQKKTGAGTPVIVDRVKLARLRLQPAGEFDQHTARQAKREKCSRLLRARPRTLQEKSYGQPGEGESRPGKNGEESGLRSSTIVYAIDVGLNRPGQPCRTPR